jgi:UDP-N-acetylmuramate--alanine ligase
MIDGTTSYQCLYRNEPLGGILIRQLGNHNVVNSLSVVAVSLELGIRFEDVSRGLADFQGVGRRLELVGEAEGVRVYDDYGHHPTEIRATLEALGKLGRRIVVVFQPHRYTRTQLLWDEFGQSFGGADEVFLTEIYPAGEQPIEGVSSRLIQDALARHRGREVEVIPRIEDIPQRVARCVLERDIVLTLGAGDVYKAAPLIVDEIRKVMK